MNISMLKQMKADGLILITNNAHTGRIIADIPMPVVVVDRQVIDGREIASVESDHYKGGRLAAQHLVECGCRNIVCFRGPQEFTSGALRFKGYRDVCEENGLPVRYIDCAFLLRRVYRLRRKCWNVILMRMVWLREMIWLRSQHIRCSAIMGFVCRSIFSWWVLMISASAAWFHRRSQRFIGRSKKWAAERYHSSIIMEMDKIMNTN